MDRVEILDFLENFGTLVRADDSISYVELMMDDHKCFEFEGKEYYVHEDHCMASEEEEKVYDYLIENHLV